MPKTIGHAHQYADSSIVPDVIRAQRGSPAALCDNARMSGRKRSNGRPSAAGERKLREVQIGFARV